MRRAFGFTLIGLLGLSVQIAACAEGTSLPTTDGGNGGSGNEGGDATGGGGKGGNGGNASCKTEVCDGIDNDCDGTTDEDCDCIAGQTEACYTGAPETSGIGRCKSGMRTCLAATNTFGPCTGEVLPATEICNALDDDCNGATDDNIADIVCGIGACMAVAPGCVNGVPGECNPGLPSLELCDGLDNDCDQLVDESFPEDGQTCNTGMPGICAMGTSLCNTGMLTCLQMNMPGMEICDGIDNDCSGTVDDNIPGTGAACATGLMGVCAAGTLSCQNGVVDCFPDVQMSPEVCDGLDNDCDGVADENNPQSGQACNTGQMGACAQGTQACMNGMLLCQATYQAQPETCNGIDDDCDGQADDGNPGGGVICSCGGMSSCTSGQIVCQGCTREVNCNNNVNDDGDNKTDCQDTDCALGCAASVGPCAMGETLLVLASSNVPRPIPDNGTTTSVIAFSETLTVKRVVMQLNITHTWDEDLRIQLTSPNNTTRIMSDSNGGLGENYTNTIFNSNCATPITSGTAPYNGCFQPEQPMSGFNNQPVKGTWTLTLTDQATYDTGTLNSWTLAICAQ